VCCAKFSRVGCLPNPKSSARWNSGNNLVDFGRVRERGRGNLIVKEIRLIDTDFCVSSLFFSLYGCNCS